jgi:hypothetical protein
VPEHAAGEDGARTAVAVARDVPSRELVIGALAAGGLGLLLGFAGWVRSGRGL